MGSLILITEIILVASSDAADKHEFSLADHWHRKKMNGPYTAAQIASLRPAQIATIPVSIWSQFDNETLLALNAAQAAAVTAKQIGAMSAQSLSIIVNKLTLLQLQAVTVDQLQSAAGLSDSTILLVNTLDSRHVQMLSLAQLSGGRGNLKASRNGHTRAEDMGWEGPFLVTQLSSQQMGYLSSTQVQGFTNEMLNALSASQIRALSFEALASISTKSLASISAQAVANIADLLGQAQTRALVAEQLQTIVSAELNGVTQSVSLLNTLDAAHVQMLSADQLQSGRVWKEMHFLWWRWDGHWEGQFISAQLSAQQMGYLTASQAAALTVEQVSALSAAQITALSAPSLAAIAPSAFAAIGVDSIVQFSASQWQAVTVAQVQAWAQRMGKQALAQLPASAVACLPPALLQQFDAGQIQALNATGLRIEQLAAKDKAGNSVLLDLSLSQLGQLAAVVVGLLSLDQLQKLDTTKVQALSAAGLTAGQLAHKDKSGASVLNDLTLEQLGQLAPAAVGGLTQAQIEQMSASRFQALNATGMVSAQLGMTDQAGNSVLGELTIKQVGQLSCAVVSALTQEQLQQMDSARIQALAAAGLTPAQLGSHDRGGNYIITDLTPAQIGALAPAVVRDMTVEQIAGLTPAQVSALTEPQLATLDLARVQAMQAQGLTAAQLGAVDNVGYTMLGDLLPEQIGVLSVSAFAGLSARQLGTLTTAQSSAISGPQIAALTNAQVQSLVTANLVSSLNREAMGAISAQQVAGTTLSIDPIVVASLGEFISSVKPAALARVTKQGMAGLTAGQAAVLTLEQVSALEENFAGLSAKALMGLRPEQLTALSDKAIASLASAFGAGAYDRLRESMTAERWGDVTATELASLSPTQLQAAFARPADREGQTVIQNLNPSAWRGLSLEQLNGLGRAQVSQISAAQLNYIPLDVLTQMSAEQTSWVSEEAMTGIDVWQLTALVIKGKLTADELRNLAPGLLQMLPEEMIKKISPAALSEIRQYDLRQIRSKLSDEQIQWMKFNQLEFGTADVGKTIVQSVQYPELASGKSALAESINTLYSSADRDTDAFYEWLRKNAPADFQLGTSAQKYSRYIAALYKGRLEQAVASIKNENPALYAQLKSKIDASFGRSVDNLTRSELLAQIANIVLITISTIDKTPDTAQAGIKVASQYLSSTKLILSAGIANLLGDSANWRTMRSAVQIAPKNVTAIGQRAYQSFFKDYGLARDLKHFKNVKIERKFSKIASEAPNLLAAVMSTISSGWSLGGSDSPYNTVVKSISFASALASMVGDFAPSASALTSNAKVSELFKVQVGRGAQILGSTLGLIALGMAQAKDIYDIWENESLSKGQKIGYTTFDAMHIGVGVGISIASILVPAAAPVFFAVEAVIGFAEVIFGISQSGGNLTAHGKVLKAINTALDTYIEELRADGYITSARLLEFMRSEAATRLADVQEKNLYNDQNKWSVFIKTAEFMGMPINGTADRQTQAKQVVAAIAAYYKKARAESIQNFLNSPISKDNGTNSDGVVGSAIYTLMMDASKYSTRVYYYYRLDIFDLVRSGPSGLYDSPAGLNLAPGATRDARLLLELDEIARNNKQISAIQERYFESITDGSAFIMAAKEKSVGDAEGLFTNTIIVPNFRKGILGSHKLNDHLSDNLVVAGHDNRIDPNTSNLWILTSTLTFNGSYDETSAIIIGDPSVLNMYMYYSTGNNVTQIYGGIKDGAKFIGSSDGGADYHVYVITMHGARSNDNINWDQDRTVLDLPSCFTVEWTRIWDISRLELYGVPTASASATNSKTLIIGTMEAFKGPESDAISVPQILTINTKDSVAWGGRNSVLIATHGGTLIGRERQNTLFVVQGGDVTAYGAFHIASKEDGKSSSSATNDVLNYADLSSLSFTGPNPASNKKTPLVSLTIDEKVVVTYDSKSAAYQYNYWDFKPLGDFVSDGVPGGKSNSYTVTRSEASAIAFSATYAATFSDKSSNNGTLMNMMGYTIGEGSNTVTLRQNGSFVIANTPSQNIRNINSFSLYGDNEYVRAGYATNKIVLNGDNDCAEVSSGTNSISMNGSNGLLCGYVDGDADGTYKAKGNNDIHVAGSGNAIYAGSGNNAVFVEQRSEVQTADTNSTRIPLVDVSDTAIFTGDGGNTHIRLDHSTTGTVIDVGTGTLGVIQGQTDCLYNIYTNISSTHERSTTAKIYWTDEDYHDASDTAKFNYAGTSNFLLKDVKYNATHAAVRVWADIRDGDNLSAFHIDGPSGGIADIYFNPSDDQSRMRNFSTSGSTSSSVSASRSMFSNINFTFEDGTLASVNMAEVVQKGFVTI